MEYFVYALYYINQLQQQEHKYIPKTVKTFIYNSQLFYSHITFNVPTQNLNFIFFIHQVIELLKKYIN